LDSDEEDRQEKTPALVLVWQNLQQDTVEMCLCHMPLKNCVPAQGH